MAAWMLNLAAIVVFYYDEAMASLLAFFGNVVQATVVLQLEIHIDSQDRNPTVMTVV